MMVNPYAASGYIFANTKSCNKAEKWQKTWHMGLDLEFRYSSHLCQLRLIRD